MMNTEELGTSRWSTRPCLRLLQEVAGTLPLQSYRNENTVQTDMQSEEEDAPDPVPVVEEILFADEDPEYDSSSESVVGDEADGEDEIEEHVINE